METNRISRKDYQQILEKKLDKAKKKRLIGMSLLVIGIICNVAFPIGPGMEAAALAGLGFVAVGLGLFRDGNSKKKKLDWVK